MVSDSLSALQSISSPPCHVKSFLALPIISLTKSLSPIQIDFLWIPGHAGIINNEIVDHRAKLARSSTTSSKLLPMSELFSLIRHSTKDDWTLHYQTSFNNPNAQYLLVQPKLQLFRRYKQFSDFRRSFIVKLSRLRFGHNLLPSHLERINISDSDLCPLHIDTPSRADINHILLECPKLETL